MPKRTDINKVLIIGSGPIIIGQACEFDYSGTQACKALRKLGYEIVLVNSNPATIMTDPETADVTYIEPLNVERLEQIIAKERPDALLPNLGGQSGLNLCSELHKSGVLEKYGVEVMQVGYDRYNAISTVQKLEAEGMECVEVKQHSSVLHPPTKLLREAILKREFAYDENRLLEINFQNARCTEDTNLNKSVNKKRSAGKVDMVISVIIALYLMQVDMLSNTELSWGIQVI